MDALPYAFCKRVTNTVNCCALLQRCECVAPVLADPKWSFAIKEKYQFLLARSNGDWKYAFKSGPLSPDYMTMEQFRKKIHNKQARIKWIGLNFKIEEHLPHLKRVDLELNKLLDFVSYLSNEPILVLHCDSTMFAQPEGAQLFAWLTERWFSSIMIPNYKEIFNKLLKNQFSRRNPTLCHVWKIESGGEFLAEKTKSGLLKRFRLFSEKLPYHLLEDIVRNFMNNPSNFEKFAITAHLEHLGCLELARETLEQMRLEGKCQIVHISRTYVFQSQAVSLQIKLYEEVRINFLKIECLKPTV